MVGALFTALGVLPIELTTYSTVTLLARLRGLSTLRPRALATR
jgi:nitric oxide reductase large subunit